MSFNELLKEAGGFGLYQKILTFGFLGFTVVTLGVTYWTQVFILFIPPHRCKETPDDNVWTANFDSLSNSSESCSMPDENNSTQVLCQHGLIYDFEQYFPTFPTENGWVCENAWKTYLTHTVYWFGAIAGTIAAGIITDKYGRKRAYQCAVALTLTADVATLFLSNQIPFQIARFFSAAGDVCIANIAFMLAIEYSAPSARRISTFMSSFSFTFISLVFPWICCLLRNWKHILIISWIPNVLMLVGSSFIPESASWLMTKGRIDEAVDCLERVARVNKKTMSREHIFAKLQDEKGQEKKIKNPFPDSSEKKINAKIKKEELTFIQAMTILIKSPNLRKRVLLAGFMWMVANAVYLGNNLSFGYLDFNLYVSLSYGALVELPSNMCTVFSLERFGRRYSSFGFCVLGGVFAFLQAVSTDNAMKVAFVVLLRFACSASFDIIIIFSSEIVPTVIRGRATSLVRTCGGLGNTLVPFVVSLSEKSTSLSYIIFGAFSFTAGLMSLFLPETVRRHLPNTIEEGENFGKGQSFWSCPFNKTFDDELADADGFKKSGTHNDQTGDGEIYIIGLKQLPDT